MACVVYGIWSLMLAIFAFRTLHIFYYSVLFLVYSMLMMMIIVLSEFGATIISPDDYEILGHRPIDSRTYFAVKLSNLFFYILLLGSALNIFPAILGAFADNSRGYFPLVYFLVSILANLFSAGLVILFYGAILKVVNYEKFKDVLVYFQVFLSFLVFFGFQVVIRSMNFIEKNQTPELSRWLLLAPPAWFASIVQVALGHFQSDFLLWAGWGLIATVVIMGAGLRSFSMDYSAHLARLRATTAKSSGKGRNWLGRVFKPVEKFLLRCPEDRAAFYFVRQMLKRNRTLKLRLYPAFGFPLAFMALGFINKTLGDPLLPGKKFQVASFLTTMAGPLAVQNFFSLLPYSEEHAASWIFRVTPIVALERFFGSVKKAFVVSLLLPLFLFLALIFSFLWTTAHALLHATMGFAVSYLYLMFVFLFYKGGFPFSREPIKAVQTEQMTLTFILLPVFAGLLGLQYLIYQFSGILWLGVVGIFILGVVLDKASNIKAARAIRLNADEGAGATPSV